MNLKTKERIKNYFTIFVFAFMAYNVSKLILILPDYLMGFIESGNNEFYNSFLYKMSKEWFDSGNHVQIKNNIEYLKYIFSDIDFYKTVILPLFGFIFSLSWILKYNRSKINKEFMLFMIVVMYFTITPLMSKFNESQKDLFNEMNKRFYLEQTVNCLKDPICKKEYDSLEIIVKNSRSKLYKFTKTDVIIMEGSFKKRGYGLNSDQIESLIIYRKNISDIKKGIVNKAYINKSKGKPYNESDLNLNTNLTESEMNTFKNQNK